MKFIFCILLLAFGMQPVNAQVEVVQAPLLELNIDSLIQDSLNKAYILNHRPLTVKERNRFVLNKQTSAYGLFANYYLTNVAWYSLSTPKNTVFSPKHIQQSLEWIFYTYLLLFLFIAMLGRFSNGQIKRMWKVFINSGFIYRQAKEQMAQQPLVALLLNLVFVFSSSLFLFFGLGWDHEFTGIYRWYILSSSFLVIVCIYLFKFIFLRTIGWAFGQKEVFDHYLFVVFLNNKLLGLLLLFSSFLLAFSGDTTTKTLFTATLVVVALMFIYRVFRGYQTFLRQARMGAFSLLLAFVSVELIPSAVVIKFVSQAVNLYLFTA